MEHRSTVGSLHGITIHVANKVYGLSVSTMRQHGWRYGMVNKKFIWTTAMGLFIGVVLERFVAYPIILLPRDTREVACTIIVFILMVVWWIGLTSVLEDD